MVQRLLTHIRQAPRREVSPLGSGGPAGTTGRGRRGTVRVLPQNVVLPCKPLRPSKGFRRHSDMLPIHQTYAPAPRVGLVVDDRPVYWSRVCIRRPSLLPVYGDELADLELLLRIPLLLLLLLLLPHPLQRQERVARRRRNAPDGLARRASASPAIRLRLPGGAPAAMGLPLAAAFS